MSPVLVMAPEFIVPANVTFAPLAVKKLDVPDLIVKLPLLFVKDPNCVPSSFKTISPPPASIFISSATLSVKAPED